MRVQEGEKSGVNVYMYGYLLYRIIVAVLDLNLKFQILVLGIPMVCWC